MSDKYEINNRNEVVPYTSGRRCNDTRAWRDATDFELQQRDQIHEWEKAYNDLKKELEESKEKHWEALDLLRDASEILGAIWTGGILRGEIDKEIEKCLNRLGGNFPPANDLAVTRGANEPTSPAKEKT